MQEQRPSRFIALHCGDETTALLAKHPNAFLLLCQIAIRAKWKDCPITRLKAGQAFVGDWREAGLKSEKAYRHAKNVLSNCGLAAFKGASKGTVATIENSTIFSITKDDPGGQTGEQGADKGRARGGQGATNHTDTQIHGHTDTLPPAPPPARASLPEVESTGRRFPDHAAICARINGMRPEWGKPAHWSAAEMHALHDALAGVYELDDQDWKTLAAFLSASVDPAAGYWQPRSRCKFLESFPDVFASAQRWAGKTGNRPKQPTPLSHPYNPAYK